MAIFYNIQTYDDIDQFSESVTWDLELVQLSAGKFHAGIILFGDEDIQIGETVYNKALLQHGSVPCGYTFAVHHPDSAPFNWRYLDFPRNGIIVFPKNREHQGVSQSNHHPFTVTIREDFLSVVAEEIGLPEPERFITRGEVHLSDPASIHQIQTLLGSLVTAMKSSGGRVAKTLMSHDTKWKIVRLLLLALTTSKITKLKKRQFTRRKKLVDRILEYIDADPATPRSVRELCRIAEENERTLRNIFYEQFSLSPNKFIKCYRLNSVRLALKSLVSPQVRVADIANENGFWHMGQFAKDYRRMFNELPSETLGIQPAD